jgi:hypothetical protein
MVFIEGNLLPECSSAGAELIELDIGVPIEAICPNILEYSDPWEQIGVIMGLQASPSKGSQMRFASQEEDNRAEDELDIERHAALESDLPPSDIMGESSLDDTLYSPSSLPIAESSETIWPCLLAAGAFPQVDSEGIWEVDFDDWAVGLKPSRFDNSSTQDIFAGGEGVSNGRAVIERGDAPGGCSFELDPAEDVKSGGAAGSPPAEEALMASPHAEPGAVECVGLCVDVLAVPELVESNGVYLGPCLLSQGSELDE